jgi:RecA-family ATPase
MQSNENETGDIRSELLGMVEAPAPMDPLDELIDKIADLRGRGTEHQQLIKARTIVESALSVPKSFGHAQNWEEYLFENQDDSYDWLTVDLLERRERVIVVAAEGVGKSMIARQIAICLGAGIHPFTEQRIDPITTLTIDLENMDRIFRRTSRRIMDVARRKTWLSSTAPIDAHFRLLPSGVNLLNGADQQGILELVGEVKPDILFMGPLYKSFIDPGGRSAESIATEIAMFYDRLREEHDCALWLEQHAPLGNGLSGRDLRPFGSAVWSRWPEFGLSLSNSVTSPGYYEVGTFRGSRDERKWPKVMHRGGPSEFPFVVDEFM